MNGIRSTSTSQPPLPVISAGREYQLKVVWRIERRESQNLVRGALKSNEPGLNLHYANEGYLIVLY